MSLLEQMVSRIDSEKKPSKLPGCFYQATQKSSVVPPSPKPVAPPKPPLQKKESVKLSGCFYQKPQKPIKVKISKAERTQCTEENSAPRSKDYNKNAWYHPAARLAAKREDALGNRYEDYKCPHCGRFLVIELLK